jgi:heavy metal sensor kinase
MQLWLAFLLALILFGFAVTAYQLHRNNQFGQIDETLARRVSALSADVRRPPPFLWNSGPGPFRPDSKPDSEGERFGPPPEERPAEHALEAPFQKWPGGEPKWHPGRPGGRRPPREIQLTATTSSLFDEAEINSHYFAIWSPDGSVLKCSTTAPAGLLQPERNSASTGIQTRTRENLREAFQFTELGDCILAGRSVSLDLKSLRQFAWLLAAAAGTVLALGLGGTWMLITRALHPVEEISATASRISLGNLSERINTADTDNELGRLAGVLNSTFAKLETAFAQQKQFTADAAHELRTPLAVIIAEAQSTLARERNAGEYRETVEGCLETAQQMRQLTQALLELARFDANQEPLQHEPIDLAEQTGTCVELVRPLANRRGLQLKCILESAVVLGDSRRIGEVATNLLSNAVQFNKEQGEIRVETRRQDGFAILTVADTGQGIAVEDLPHIFERFYQADKSRSRSGGHSGLGLAICKAIVDAHGGTIEASSQQTVGTIFTVKLPLANPKGMTI